MVVVLPEPLTPTTRMTNGFCCFVNGKRHCDRRQHLFDFGRDHALHVIGRDRLVVTANADGGRDARGHFGAEIGAQQHILDVLEHGAVELALGDEIGNGRPSELEVRFRPPDNRRHQLCLVVSFMARTVLAVSRHERKS